MVFCENWFTYNMISPYGEMPLNGQQNNPKHITHVTCNNDKH